MFAARSSGSRAPAGRSPSESAKPSASSSSWPGRAHGHGDGTAADPDLERLLDGDDILGVAVREANDIHPGCRIRRHAHDASILARVQVVVVGSGAREHALAWRLAQSPRLTELHAAPGNPGIAELGRCHPVRADDADGLLSLAMTLEADLVVIGPEGPLVAGIADGLRRNGIAVFGPSAAAAQIEGSKSFAKDVLRAAGVPTAEALSVARPPCVVKADGLAAGKGVFVCRTAEELDEALRAVSAFGGEFVIEELLEGEEVSLFALSDGTRVVPLGAAQDFKRIGDGDTGPNTGGMGAYSPVPWLDGRRRARRADPPAGGRRARPPRGAVRRLPLRRADDDRGRPEGARVQRALRRPGDAGADAAPRGRPARTAARGGQRRPVGRGPLRCPRTQR